MKNNLNILAIIPARMGSTRFPGKPMKEINGKPMIGHVYHNVMKNKLISEVIVATCDKEIFDYIELIGGTPVMTSSDHERASDRCSEALKYFEKSQNKVYDIIVMIQGDEPMINAEMIEEALEPMLKSSEIVIANLIGRIESKEEFNDPNCIKVVCDSNNDALFFSRKSIPTDSNFNDLCNGKQICVIPFRREFLIKYTKLKPTPLEQKESIDMLRVLEHGYKVRMVRTKHKSYAVDTEEDLNKVKKLIR
jgi:3-deoxy-manno-octulosonate cytidylyltransferase (CMP-KDO synthetase)